MWLYISIAIKHKKLLTVSIFFACTLLIGISLLWRFITIATTTTTQTLLLPSSGTYYGYYLSRLNTHPQNPTISLLTNEKPSLTMYYQDWAGDQPFDIVFMNTLSDQHVIPVVTWEPWNQKEAEKGQKIQVAYSSQVIASGRYDAFITRWAKKAAEFKKPYFLRFAHEMNGNWYPWGNVGKSTSEDYKRMWIHVHSLFEKAGATNTLWVWSPNNTDETGSRASLVSFYPGDAYVDWVGYSGFNWGNTAYTHWLSFVQIAQDTYGILSQFNKPIMVAETSSVGKGGNKAQWFDDLITNLPTLPRIKAIIFYNDNDRENDFKLSSGMNSSEVITTNIVNNSYMIKNPIIQTTTQHNSINSLWNHIQ